MTSTYFSYIVLCFFASIGIIAVLWIFLEFWLLRGKGGQILLFLPLYKGEETLERDIQRVLFSNTPVLYDRILLVDFGADEETLDYAKYLAFTYPNVSLITEEAILDCFTVTPEETIRED